MAWYSVTYSCGHSGRVQLYGKVSDRERKIAWYERSGHCPECFARLKAKENAAPAAKALIIEAELSELESARLIRPTEPKIETPCRIMSGDGAIKIFTPEYNQNVVGFLRRLGFSRDRDYWLLKSDSDNIITEAAVNLLAEGYIVILPSEKLVDNVVKLDYEPFNSRKIKAINGKFGIIWDRSDGDFYGAARRLSGSKWDSERKLVSVPLTSFIDVEDFAERCGFEMSAKAQELIKKARILRDSALTIDVKPKTANLPHPPSATPPKLKAPTEVKIDESLRDDD